MLLLAAACKLADAPATAAAADDTPSASVIREMSEARLSVCRCVTVACCRPAAAEAAEDDASSSADVGRTGANSPQTAGRLSAGSERVRSSAPGPAGALVRCNCSANPGKPADGEGSGEDTAATLECEVKATGALDRTKGAASLIAASGKLSVASGASTVAETGPGPRPLDAGDKLVVGVPPQPAMPYESVEAAASEEEIGSRLPGSGCECDRCDGVCGASCSDVEQRSAVTLSVTGK